MESFEEMRVKYFYADRIESRDPVIQSWEIFETAVYSFALRGTHARTVVPSPTTEDISTSPLDALLRNDWIFIYRQMYSPELTPTL